MKTKVGVTLDVEVLGALRDLTGEEVPATAVAGAVEDYVEAMTEARKHLQGVWNALTWEFASAAGVEPQGAVVVPPLRLRPVHTWTGPEPVALLPEVLTGMDEVARAAGALDDVIPPAVPRYDSNLLAAWGTALGRALGLDALHAVALGEFVRAWTGGVSCRFGNLDLLVAEAEFAFAGGLTGRVGRGVVMWAPETRRLFPAREEEKPAYRLAWRAVLEVLRGHAEGRFREDEDGIRLFAADGRTAAETVLEALAKEEARS